VSFECIKGPRADDGRHAARMPPKSTKKARADEEGNSSPGAMSTEEDAGGAGAALFGGDFAHCELRGFTGSLGADNKNAKLIMMNAAAIPCCAERCHADEKKSTPVKMTVLACHSPGFSVAPYVVPFGGGKVRARVACACARGAARCVRAWRVRVREGRQGACARGVCVCERGG
jgi:hypothetical protein